MAKEVKTVTNQKLIEVQKQDLKENELFVLISSESVSNASKNLQSKAGFKLYIYIARNQDKYRFGLSSEDFCMWAGVGIRAYRSAVEELIDLGYLEKKQGNLYIFHTYRPLEANADLEITFE